MSNNDGASAFADRAASPSDRSHDVSPQSSIPSAATKSLAEIKSDMSALYDQVRSGHCDLKLASELANITGKFLKAEQLIFAREVFLSNQPEQRRLSNGDDK